MLRTRLAKVAKKPPEYYEVVYNAATCLFTESLKTQNRRRRCRPSNCSTPRWCSART